MFRSDEDRWAAGLFGKADLGDTRRTSRLVQLTAAMAKNPCLSVDAACGFGSAEAEGAHRLVRNKKFGAEAIFEAGAESTAEAAAEMTGELLALEDTTTLSFPHSIAEKLGDLGGKKGKTGNGGWWVHSTLLFTQAEHMPLGPITQHRWCRPSETRGKKHQRRQRSYEQKESFKWEQASRAMQDRLGTKTMERVISVCDREADVFEYLAFKLGKNQRFVVRASWNRNVKAEHGAERQRLWEIMEAEPVATRFSLNTTQKGGRPKRTVELSLRYRPVTLALPNNRRATAVAPLDLWVLYVKEEHPPEQVQPLEWMLLTSETMRDEEQAMRVLGHYRARWNIEDWHKAWKTGCRVEDRRQQDVDNLEKVAVITAFIAVRLLQLRALAKTGGEAACDKELPDLEWKCLWLSVEKKPLPSKPPDQLWAYQTIGKLGGWKDSKRDGKIGWLLLYRGWVRLQERIEGFRLAMSLQASTGDVTK